MSVNILKLVRAQITVETGPPPVNTLAPSIGPTARVGVALVVVSGTWTGADFLSYRWLANGSPISGATGTSFTPTLAELGKTISIEERATNGFGSATVISPSTTAVDNPGGENTVYFGDKTRRGHGGYDVGVGTTISSGNTGSVWTVDSDGRLVLSGTYGAAPPALTYPYTLGLSNGTTLTVQSVANSYSIAPKLSVDSGSTNQLNTVLNSGTVNYGDTVILRNGSTFGLNDSGDINDLPKMLSVRLAASTNFGVRSGGPTAPTHQGWGAPTYVGTTHSLPGWVTIRPETPLGATWTRLDFNGYDKTNQYIKVDGVNFISYNVGLTSSASTSAIWARSEGPNATTAIKWIAVVNCAFQSRIEAGTNSMMSAIIFKQTASESGNFYVYDNYFYNVYNGVVRQGKTLEIVGNDFHFCYNDACKGIIFDCLHSWNIIRDKTFVGTAHGDYFQEQWEDILPGTYQGSTYVGNIMYIGNHGAPGAVGGQGVFISGAEEGVIIDGIVVKGNVYVDAMVRGISITRGRNADVKYNVIVRDQADTYPVGSPMIIFSQTTGGIAKNNAFWTSGTPGPSPIDTTDGTITPPTDIGNYGLNAATYAAAYNAPIFGPTYTIAQLRQGFTSKVGGPLDATPDKGIGVGTTYVDFVNRTTNFPD